MEIKEFNKDEAIISLDWGELNIALQCMAEIVDKWSDNDLQTVMLTTAQGLRKFNDEVHDLMNKMRAGSALIYTFRKK